MSNLAALILGALVSVLWLVVWSMMTDIVPGGVGARGTLTGIIMALIAGLVVYLTFSQRR